MNKLQEKPVKQPQVAAPRHSNLIIFTNLSMSTAKETAKRRRHCKIRRKIKGTAKRPRLVIYKSLLYTYAQLVNDEKGQILAASSDVKEKTKGTKSEKAHKVGMEIAKKAVDKKITEVVFDRGGYKYHGRVKAVAQGAREGGLKF